MVNQIATWDGVTRNEALPAREAELRHSIADAARDYQWPRLLELLCEHEDRVNATRPGGSSWYAPLHQAAHGGAPPQVVLRLIDMGAWRTLRTAENERPLDIARNLGHQQLLALLVPLLRHTVDLDELRAIQKHFHALILERAGELVQAHALRLPELEPLLELFRPRMWFPVPGMFGGGFRYELDTAGPEVKLVCASWSSASGASQERHEISARGVLDVESESALAPAR